MQESATPTAPVQPLEESVQTDPAAPGPEEAQPAPEVAPEQPPEAEAGAEEEQAPPWASVKERDGLKEHVQPLLEEADQSGYDRRSGELNEYAQRQFQERAQTLNDVKAGLGRATKGMETLLKQASASGVDVEQISEFINTHGTAIGAAAADWSDPDGQYPGFWRFFGGKQSMTSLARAAGDQDIAQPFMARMDAFAHGFPDNNLFGDFVKKLSVKAVTDAEKPLKERLTARDAEIAGLKERIRTGKGPDLIPKGGARGNDNELLLDPNTPIETVNEILARQRAGS